MIVDLPPAARGIVDVLRRAGHRAYIAGGAVRDSLLGFVPKDFDIATDATPERVETLFERTAPIGRAFGVIAVVVDGATYEVATFRAESGYADGRRPDQVRFSTPEADVQRRDFTVNALLYDPENDAVLDFVGGRADLDAKLLRTVGDAGQRFREDHLRPLRAVRFAARLDFRLEENTARALNENAGLVATVAPERVAAELAAMLTGGHSRDAFALLDRHALLPVVLPEMAALRGVRQPPQFHPEGDVWTHTLLMLELADAAFRGNWRDTLGDGLVPPVDFAAFGEDGADDAVRRGMTVGLWPAEKRAGAVAETWSAMDEAARLALAWALALHDIGKPATFTVSDRIRFHDHDRLGREMAEAVLTRLHRPRALVMTVRDLVGRHIHFANLRRMRISKRRRWMQEDEAPLHLELHRIDCTASHGMLANWEFGMEAWREERARPPVTRPLIAGGDLLALGIRPGPALGALLREVADARLEGVITTRAEALAWVRQRRPDADGF